MPGKRQYPKLTLKRPRKRMTRDVSKAIIHRLLLKLINEALGKKMFGGRRMMKRRDYDPNIGKKIWGYLPKP